MAVMLDLLVYVHNTMISTTKTDAENIIKAEH